MTPLSSWCASESSTPSRFFSQSYDSVPDRISATLIGVALTSIVFLSGISFAISKGNVVETSLMLA